MPEQANDFPVNSIRICIDWKENNDIRGSIAGVAMERAIPFRSMAGFLLEMEDALDRIGRPQASLNLRTFQTEDDKPEEQVASHFVAQPRRYHTAEEIRALTGEYETYDILVVTRRHASCQGIVKRTDGSSKGRFQSDLELIRLLIH